MAREDLHSRTALTEARLVTGNAGSSRSCSTGPGERPPARPQARREAFLESMRARRRPSATREVGGRGVRPGAQREGGRGRPARPARRALGGPRAPRHAAGSPASHAAGWPLRRASTGARAAPTTSCCACATRPTSPPAARPTCSTLDLQPDLAKSLGYEAERRPARLRAVHARLLPARLRAPRDLPRRRCGARPPRPAPAPLRRPPERRPAARLRGARRAAARARAGAAVDGRGACSRPSPPPRPRACRSPTSSTLAIARAAVRSSTGGSGASRERPRVPRPPALARAGGAGAARDARDGLPRPLPARVRPRHLPRAARLLPPLHGGRAHAEVPIEALDEVAAGRSPACAPLRPRLRRGRGRGPALPRACCSTTSARGAAGGHVERGARLAPAGLRPPGPRRARRRRTWSSWSPPTSRCRSSRSSATSPSRRSIDVFAERVGSLERLNLLHPPDLRRPPRRRPRHLERVEGRRCSGSSTTGRASASPGTPAEASPGQARSGAGHRGAPAASSPAGGARAALRAAARALPARHRRRRTWSGTSASLRVAGRRARRRSNGATCADGQCTELTVVAAATGPGSSPPSRAPSPRTASTSWPSTSSPASDGRRRSTRFRLSESPATARCGPSGARGSSSERASTRSPAGSTSRPRWTRWRHAEPARARAGAWGRAARGPVGALRPRVLGHGHRDRGAGPGPARPRLHASPTRSPRLGLDITLRQDRHRQGAGPRRLLRDRRAGRKLEPGGLAAVEAGAAGRASATGPTDQYH